MNKKYIAIVLLLVVILNYNTVFAEQNEYSYSFLTELQIPKKENVVVLTLEEATQRA